MALTELEEKTERITELLDRENLGAVLLNAQHNFAWLTGGSTNGIDLSRENGAASLLVTRSGKRYLLANNIELPRMLAEEVSADDFEPVDFSWQEEKAVGDTALRKAKALADGEITTDISLFAGAAAIEGKIAKCRYKLTRNELIRYRELGRDAGAIMRKVIEEIAPGDTEISIAAKIRSASARHNVSSVVTLVAADERIARFRHPVPTENSWKKTLLMVTCAKRFGLIVSLSRIVCIGSIPDDLQRKTEANASVNAALSAATRSGVTGAEMYTTAATAYAAAGFDGEIDKHHQGGAAGYKTREWVAHPQSSEIVHLNQAFAWNPSITGTKVEETILTTERGIEVITTSPDFPQIETNLNGQPFFSPGILSI
ncbi:MAG TPA: M24 family metallopeptidase [Pyrinomonadaceae bacterium]|nr:M24 family metallopeptidase [Acidobacteriota bacterium]HQZ94961.1 M24 family metallopeptidase [Pyrinomonadaceae bacterium]